MIHHRFISHPSEMDDQHKVEKSSEVPLVKYTEIRPPIRGWLNSELSIFFWIFSKFPQWGYFTVSQMVRRRSEIDWREIDPYIFSITATGIFTSWISGQLLGQRFVGNCWKVKFVEGTWVDHGDYQSQLTDGWPLEVNQPEAVMHTSIS